MAMRLNGEQIRLGVLPLFKECLEFSIVAQTVLRFAKLPNSLKSNIKLTYPIFFKDKLKGKQYCYGT